MITTQREILQFMEDYDVKFVRLAFFDLFGNQKNISIMSNELKRIFEKGLSFDASAIQCFQEINESDLFLFPDINTLQILPWRPQIGRVARMYCKILYPDGTPFEMDCRSLLKKKMDEIRKDGYDIMAGSECEFYLFKCDDEGNPTWLPYDQAGYCDIAPLDKGENVRREICLDLEEMGIEPECSHHEQGPGQNEIDFKFDEVVTTCDHIVTFKNVVDMVALMNGLHACFEPKPLKKHAGNGLHINLSVFKDGMNLFDQDPTFMNSFVAGILKYIKDITLFLNSCSESYERLGEFKAPKYISYSTSNRSSLIRIPSADGIRTRVELRSPDPKANPYLALLLIIQAGMKGIKQNLHVEPVDENVYLYHDHLDVLPLSLKDAIAYTKNSEFVKEVLPERMIEQFIQVKMQEK